MVLASHPQSSEDAKGDLQQLESSAEYIYFTTSFHVEEYNYEDADEAEKTHPAE